MSEKRVQCEECGTEHEPDVPCPAEDEDDEEETKAAEAFAERAWSGNS